MIVKKLFQVWWDSGVTKSTKKRVYVQMVANTSLHASEVWEITAKNRKRIETVEMDYLKRCYQQVDKSITSIIEDKQLKCYRHIMEMDVLEFLKAYIIGYFQKERRREDPNKHSSKAFRKPWHWTDWTIWNYGCCKRR